MCWGKLNRRKVLSKGVGFVGLATGLVGKGAADTRHRGINPNFDPYDFQEVDAFVDALLNHPGQGKDRRRRSRQEGVVNALNQTQKQALQDAIRPSVLEVATDPSCRVGNFDGESARTTQTFVGNNPVERWGWDVTEAVGRTSHESRVGVASGSRHQKSATVHSYALSFDFDAYKWRAEIQWESGSSNTVINTNRGDTVLDTHYAIDHKGTSVDVYDDNQTYDVEFQAKFYNRLPKICDPVFGLCIDLSEQFHPYIRLRGHPDGTSEVVYKDDDSLV